MNAFWTRNSGSLEKISDMQENHLANAYAKSLREGVNAKVRPFLAAEIVSRGVEALVPDSFRARIGADAAALSF